MSTVKSENIGPGSPTFVTLPGRFQVNADLSVSFVFEGVSQHGFFNASIPILDLKEQPETPEALRDQACSWLRVIRPEVWKVYEARWQVAGIPVRPLQETGGAS